MSFNARIKGAVDKAFAAVGDLVRTGTLTSTNVGAYNFATGTTTKTNKSVKVSVIIMTETNSSTEVKTIKAMLKSGTDMTVYDKLKVDKITYNIVDTEDDGFTINATIVREQS